MEKYMLVLRTVRDEDPKEFVALDVEGPRVPMGGEMIDTMGMLDYIKKFSGEKNGPLYISNFTHSRFRVIDVEHIPEYMGGKLETVIKVTALKV